MTHNDGVMLAVGYSYDSATNGIGRLYSVSDGYAGTFYTAYDPLGRVTANYEGAENQTYPFTYAYNLAGALISETYPSGRVITTGFDGANRASQVTGKNGSVTTNYVSGVPMLRTVFRTTTPTETGSRGRCPFPSCFTAAAPRAWRTDSESSLDYFGARSLVFANGAPAARARNHRNGALPADRAQSQKLTIFYLFQHLRLNPAPTPACVHSRATVLRTPYEPDRQAVRDKNSTQKTSAALSDLQRTGLQPPP